MVCGQHYELVIDETNADYLHQTAEPHETIREQLLERRALIDDLQGGVFTLVPWGVSQATACDGQVYDIPS